MPRFSDANSLMRRIHDAFNPDSSLNPGKIFPLSKGCGEIRVPSPARQGSSAVSTLLTSPASESWWNSVRTSDVAASIAIRDARRWLFEAPRAEESRKFEFRRGGKVGTWLAARAANWIWNAAERTTWLDIPPLPDRAHDRAT